MRQAKGPRTKGQECARILPGSSHTAVPPTLAPSDAFPCPSSPSPYRNFLPVSIWSSQYHVTEPGSRCRRLPCDATVVVAAGMVFSNPDLVYLLLHPVVHFSTAVRDTSSLASTRLSRIVSRRCLTSAVPLSMTATVCHTKQSAHAVINQSCQCRQCRQHFSTNFLTSGT